MVFTVLLDANDENLNGDYLADKGKTISYEVLTNISARVPRVYKK